jgi:hypothetical protein
MELIDPTTGAARQTIAYAPRPQALAGKRIALIENTKFNSDRLLEKIGQILKTEYGAADAKMWRKKNASVPAHQEIIEEVRKTCDVMVAGIGD